jgi:hypothetical protein
MTVPQIYSASTARSPQPGADCTAASHGLYRPQRDPVLAWCALGPSSSGRRGAALKPTESMSPLARLDYCQARVDAAGVAAHWHHTGIPATIDTLAPE